MAEVGDLPPRTFIREEPEYVHRDRNGDLADRFGLAPVFDIRVDVRVYRHISITRAFQRRENYSCRPAVSTSFRCVTITCTKTAHSRRGIRRASGALID